MDEDKIALTLIDKKITPEVMDFINHIGREKYESIFDFHMSMHALHILYSAFVLFSSCWLC